MFLSEKFDDEELAVSAIPDPGTTGNFEVTLDGVLIHSKKAGKGRAESQAERDQIVAAIEAGQQKS
jgi:selT/selW/selH-like putative selenoprotein